MSKLTTQLNQCPRIFSRNQNGQQGSVLVEFLYCFPAFILICLFLFEVCLISVDKHIVRLATFEAARVYASTDRIVFDKNGVAQTNPCLSDSAKTQARLAATKKLASIAPQVDLLLAKAVPSLGSFLSSVPAGLDSVLPGFAKRLLLRWFSASFLTEIRCQYDAPNNLVNVEIIYSRILETPVANRLIYTTHKFLEKVGPDPSTEIDFDPLIAQTKVLLTDDQTKKNLKNHLLDLANRPDKETALKNISMIVGGGVDLSSLPILTFLPTEDPSKKFKSSLDSIIAIAKEAAVLLDLEPEIFWRLPLSSKVSLNREFQTAGLRFEGGNAQADVWKPNMVGTMKFDGPYRDWALRLSNPSKFLDVKTDRVE